MKAALTAAQQACLRRAEDPGTGPYGSSVLIGVRDLGRDEYEATLATGSCRSRGAANASGDVCGMSTYKAAGSRKI